MTGRGSVIISGDDLQEGDEYLEQALFTWSANNEACRYNTWQSVFFQLQNMGYTDINAPSDETQRERQKRMKRLYREIQLEVHGAVYDSLDISSDAGMDPPPGRSDGSQPPFQSGPQIFDMDRADTPRDLGHFESYSPDQEVAIVAVAQTSPLR